MHWLNQCVPQAWKKMSMYTIFFWSKCGHICVVLGQLSLTRKQYRAQPDAACWQWAWSVWQRWHCWSVWDEAAEGSFERGGWHHWYCTKRKQTNGRTLTYATIEDSDVDQLQLNNHLSYYKPLLIPLSKFNTTTQIDTNCTQRWFWSSVRRYCIACNIVHLLTLWFWSQKQA